MFQFYFQQSGTRRKQFKVTGEYCSIGSARSNDLVLNTRKVSKRHLELVLKPGGVHIEDLGSSSGTWVNRERIRSYGPLSELDEILFGDVSLWLDKDSASPGTVGSDHSSSAEFPRIQPSENTVVRAASSKPVIAKPSSPINSSEIESYSGSNTPSHMVEVEDLEIDYWGGIVHELLLQQMDLRRKDVNRMSDDDLRVEASGLLDGIVERLHLQLPQNLDVEQVKRNVLNEAIGLGPLEKFLEDDEVTEIMVNSHLEIFIEKAGQIQKSKYTFSSAHAVYSVIERIIIPLGRRIDESSPIVDARLKDGSRVNAVIPPLALKGPSLTIRKFPKFKLQFSDLIGYGSLNEAMVDFLRVCVEKHRNIIVSGGTGSGKTTLLNVLSNFIPSRERIVTIEDAAELKLVQPNLVSLESRPPNLEGKGEVAIRELVRNSLRMRPDRIVVGECRGGEAIDMLQAMNTGHDGSLTTIHANNPRDVISRLEVLVLMAGMDLPVQAIREQISSAVHLIVQQTRFPCGTRKITKITEVVGIESGTVQLQDIFEFKREGLDGDGKIVGSFKASGFIPTFYEELRDIGMDVDLSIFSGEMFE